MIFKIIFVAFIVAGTHASRSPAEIRQWLLSQALDCTKSNFVSAKELQMLMSLHLPNTKSSNCFIACVYKKVVWMDEKGQYNVETAKKMADRDYADDPTKMENAKKIFELCKTVNDEAVSDGEAGCERAHNLAKCFLDNAPKLGFDLSKMQ
ncbi:general odorant-binding protein 28a-like [Ostrinia nubilalis]|uniref:general odorant-binding protein 28a-like n=1 Tax=Ostrinia nubilalis TaxID=29057 RepID=UPI0030826923